MVQDMPRLIGGDRLAHQQGIAWVVLDQQNVQGAGQIRMVHPSSPMGGLVSVSAPISARHEAIVSLFARFVPNVSTAIPLFEGVRE
jgi:hypothetical protein